MSAEVIQTKISPGGTPFASNSLIYVKLTLNMTAFARRFCPVRINPPRERMPSKENKRYSPPSLESSGLEG